MTMKNDAKFKEKLTCGFNYGMRNLVNFHPTTQKSENFFSMEKKFPADLDTFTEGILKETSFFVQWGDWFLYDKDIDLW